MLDLNGSRRHRERVFLRLAVVPNANRQLLVRNEHLHQVELTALYVDAIIRHQHITRHDAGSLCGRLWIDRDNDRIVEVPNEILVGRNVHRTRSLCVDPDPALQKRHAPSGRAKHYPIRPHRHQRVDAFAHSLEFGSARRNRVELAHHASDRVEPRLGHQKRAKFRRISWFSKSNGAPDTLGAEWRAQTKSEECGGGAADHHGLHLYMSHQYLVIFMLAGMTAFSCRSVASR
jgi:hypothetical protein